ncbi:MAG TPA: sulfite exporter TauE/SafE family protein [Patescibacteria group bacterium]|nr:sulfite exporter TauE/SafE family protein [Patescibacteria group bacterium]
MRRPGLAFAFAVPIAVLGGLIGLGGAEFRLPVLAGTLRYTAREAVPLNLAVSLVTLVTALVTRAGSLSLDPLAPFLPAVAAMIVGAAITAFVGPSIAGRLSNAWLDRVILVLLVGIGVALIVESFLPEATVSLVPRDLWPIAAFALGLCIGLVSSLLGVAGGELIIPSFVFAFGAPIKVAGSLSLLVSIPTVVIGIARYARRGNYADRSALRDTVTPMAVGSVIGAVIGGLLVGLLSPALLKLALGVILIGSALRVFSHRKSG